MAACIPTHLPKFFARCRCHKKMSKAQKQKQNNNGAMESRFPIQYAILLGEERDEHHPRRGVIQTGRCAFIRFVANEGEFRRFCERVDAVKNYISNLNKSYEAGELTEPEYRASLEHHWLNVVVRAFVMEYGVQSVPLDVQRSVDEVVGHLNSDILNDIIVDGWPPVRLVGVGTPVGTPDSIISALFM